MVLTLAWLLCGCPRDPHSRRARFYMWLIRVDSGAVTDAVTNIREREERRNR